MPDNRITPDYSESSSGSGGNNSSPSSCYSASPHYLTQSVSPIDTHGIANLTLHMDTYNPQMSYSNFQYNEQSYQQIPITSAIQNINITSSYNPINTFACMDHSNSNIPIFTGTTYQQIGNDFTTNFPYQCISNSIPQSSASPLSSSNFMATLKIIEPPVEKFRFRYKSEMHGTHGSLNGANSKRSPKTFPEVEISGFTESAIIRCSLFQVNIDSPHSHQLVVRKDDMDINDPHDVEVGPTIGYIAQFQNMGIIHTAKKNIRDELYKKKKNRLCFQLGVDNLTKKQENELDNDTERETKMMNLNQVRLCFEAFKKEQSGTFTPIAAPVFSNAINNRKSAQTGELRITRMSIATGKMTGGDEMILLVEKVSKKNIKIRFYELNSDGEETWEAYAKFNESDVHHQYAIICQTPPYKNAEYEEPVKVYIELVRPSDDERSEKMKEPFTYKPVYNNRKRRRMYSSSTNSSGSIKSDIIPNIISNVSDLSLSFLGQPSSNFNSEDILRIAPTFIDDGTLQRDGTSNDSLTFNKPVTTNRISSNLLNCYEIINKLYTKSIGDPSSDKHKIKSEIIKLYKSYSSSNAYGDSVVHDIINNGDTKLGINIYKVLEKLQLNSLLNECLNAKNESVLHCACLNNAPDFIRSSIGAGCNPNIKDKYGNTALHLAVRERNLNCVESLLKATSTISSNRGENEIDNVKIKCDLSIKNDDGLTPLHLAIKQESFDISQLLLKTNGSISKERCCKDGNNALHMAVIGKNPDLVQAILEHSPTLEIVNDVNNANLSPIQLAKVHNISTKENDKIIEMLSPFQSDTDDITIKEEECSSVSSDEDDIYNADKEFLANNEEQLYDENEINQENVILQQNFEKCLNDDKLEKKLIELLNDKDKWKELLESSKHSYLVYLCTDATSLMNYIRKDIRNEGKITDFAIIFKEEIKEVLK